MFEQALSPAARDLIQNLNSELERFGFYLGGGSGLALQLGHRISEDLDFFTANEFTAEAVSRWLETRQGYEETLVSPGTLHCRLGKVKLSFIHFAVPLCYPLVEFAGIKVSDWRDIIADKFKTLSQRGSRKDFFDLYAGFTLGNLSIADSVRLVRQRFAGTGLDFYHVLKSLGYFKDADNEPELNLLKPVPWEDVKGFFLQHLKEFEKYLLAD